MATLLSDADFFGAAAPIKPSNALLDAVETVESGGNDNAVSPKGAVGPMQTMPATLENPGFGVQPAADTSPAEERRVGKDYLRAMMKRYGGDVDKALAAYNAGPRAVDKAVASAGDNYMNLLPTETQNYVQKVRDAAGTLSRTPESPSPGVKVFVASERGADMGGAATASPTIRPSAKAPLLSDAEFMGGATAAPQPAEPAAPASASAVEQPVEAGASSAPAETSAPAPEAPADPSAKGQADQSTPHPETGLTALAAQGATFGLSDEAGAAGAATGRFLKDIASGKGFAEAMKNASDRYDAVLAEERAGIKSYQQEHPVAGTAAEVVGGASMLPAKAGQAAVALPKAIQKLPAWAKSVGLGSLFGGLFGFGTGEGGAVDRLESAGEGAATGAATAGVVHGAARIGQAAINKAASLFAGPDKTAMRKIVEAMSRDEITPAQAKARLQALGAQATVADVGGENVRGLARGAAGSPGAAKNRVTTVLQQRAESEPTRIAAAVNKGLQPDDYFGAEDQLLTKLRDNAQTAYQAAYEANPVVTSPRLDRMLQSPIVKQGVRQAARDAEMMRAAGESKWLGPVDDELTALARELAPEGKVTDGGKTVGSVGKGVAQGLSLETWQAIKEGLDKVLDSPAYTNELTGKLNSRGYAVDQLRRALVRQLDNATGGEDSLYRLARQQYAGDAQTVSALRDGKNFLKLAPEQIGKQLDGMSDASKAAYRSGAARVLMDIVAKTPDQASAARRLFGNAALRSKIRAIFPDSQSYLDFARRMVAEQRFAQTKNDILAGSRTTPMAQEIKDVERPLHAAGAIIGSSIPGVRHLVAAGVGGRALGALAPKIIQEEAVRNALARRLVNRNQAMNQGLIDEIDKLMKGAKAGAPAKAKQKAVANMVAILAGKEAGGHVHQNQSP